MLPTLSNGANDCYHRKLLGELNETLTPRVHGLCLLVLILFFIYYYGEGTCPCVGGVGLHSREEAE